MQRGPIQRYLEEQPDIGIAIVFGSYAQGQANSESDLDLAIAAGKPLTAERKIELIKALSILTLRPIDLIDLHTAPHSILQSILVSGNILKKTDTKLYAKLLRRLWNWDADMSANYNYILRQRRERAFH